MYRQALSRSAIVGLWVGTRPARGAGSAGELPHAGLWGCRPLDEKIALPLFRADFNVQSFPQFGVCRLISPLFYGMIQKILSDGSRYEANPGVSPVLR